jgi:hypothetical protein
VSQSRKKPQSRYKAPPKKKPLRTSVASPKLSPQQIAVIGGLLSGYFVVESVLYNRLNELKVILTTTSLTDLPILGNKEREELEDIPLDVIASETGLPTLTITPTL